MTGFEKSQLLCTQQWDTLFTIKWWLYTLTNNSGRYLYWKLPWLTFAVACFWPVRCLQVRQSLNGFIYPGQADSWVQFTTPLADDFSHEFSCFVCDMWSWKWHQWTLFSVDIAFACHLWLPITLHSYRSACGIGYSRVK